MRTLIMLTLLSMAAADDFQKHLDNGSTIALVLFIMAFCVFVVWQYAKWFYPNADNETRIGQIKSYSWMVILFIGFVILADYMIVYFISWNGHSYPDDYAGMELMGKFGYGTYVVCAIAIGILISARAYRWTYRKSNSENQSTQPQDTQIQLRL